MSAHRRKPKKHLAIFWVMALLGTNLEMATRWWSGDLSNFRGLRFASLAGWSSLWMLFVYGLAGILLGGLNGTRIGKLPMALQCFAGMVICLILELVTGAVLNLVLGLHVWDYADGAPSLWRLNYKGQVALVGAVRFFFIAPFAFWLDDILRYVVYDERKPATLFSYYKCLFTGGTGFPQRHTAHVKVEVGERPPPEPQSPGPQDGGPGSRD